MSKTTATDQKTAADPQGNGATSTASKPKPKKRGRPKSTTAKKPTKTAANSTGSEPKPTPPPAETTATSQGPGRPKGPAEKIPEVNASLTRCKKCNSTERTPYYGTVTRDLSGIGPDGQPFNRMTWRRTKCASCGQARADVFHEMVPEV